LRPDERRDASVAVLAVLLAAIFLARVFLGDPGLVELVPILAAAWFLGLRAARIAAGVAAVLLVAATILQPEFAPATLALRIPLMFVPGELVGRLVAQRRRQAAELQNLRWIQDVLAPIDPPDLPLLEMATRYVPAERGVAGDFYLVTEGRNNSTIVIVGDVAGKGIDAARRATFVRATMTACAHYSDDPLYLLRMANGELIRQHGASSAFITMLCLVVQADGAIVWSTAGHPPPVSLEDGAAIGEPQASYPLGIAPELTATAWRTHMPEQGILLYTDGLIDARPPGKSYEPFGSKRLANALSSLRDPSPERAVEELERAARRFARGALPDDLCLIALRSKIRTSHLNGDGLGRGGGEEVRPTAGRRDGSSLEAPRPVDAG
jgi:hypothetical protein